MRLLLATLLLARLSEARVPQPDDLDPIVIINGNLGGAPTFGAGIIFSREKDTIYIVTANHVVRSGGTAATQLTVRLRNAPDKKLRTEVTQHFDAVLDLAVLSVQNPAAQGVDMCGVSLVGQLAQPGSAERGDSVFPLGDPNGVAWTLPVRPDAISEIQNDEIIFESSLIAKGDSGGGLLNDHGGFVGLIQADEPPYGRALSFDKVLAVLKGWNYVVDLDAPDENNNGNPPIFSAVANGRIEEVKRWLARPCADVNIHGNGSDTALAYAHGNLPMVKLLVSAGADVRGAANLIQYTSSADEVRFLLSQGAKCDGELTSAAAHGPLEKLKALLQGCPAAKEERNGALFAAVESGGDSGSLLQALIQAGADVNVLDNFSKTPLDHAVSLLKPNRAGLLIAAGGRYGPNSSKTVDYFCALNPSNLALEMVERYHSTASVLANSCDISDRNANDKLLVRAAEQEWTDVIQSLIDRGADVKTDAGRSALAFASRVGQVKIATALLRSGVSPDARDIHEVTLFDQFLENAGSISDDKKRRELLELLVEYGANVKEKPGPEAKRLYYPLFQWKPPDLGSAEVLVTHGADVNGRVGYGAAGTYLHFARGEHMQEVVDFLLKHGAKDVDAGHY